MMLRSDVVQTTVRSLRKAETSLPNWVLELIEHAMENETNIVARSHLQFMLENVCIAEETKLPLCQDTGLPIFHLEVGRDLRLDFDLQDAIAEGVRIASKEIPLRPNVVDPLTRRNTGDNTGIGMPDIILETS